MPDITMCKNKLCPLKESCYRFTAQPNPYWQSYRSFKPNEDGKCDYFWDNRIKWLDYQKDIIEKLTDAFDNKRDKNEK